MSQPTAPSEILAERYGRGRGNRRRQRVWVIVLAAALLAIGGGWLIWANAGNPASTVDGEDTAHRIIDAHHISISYSIDTNPGTRVACVVEAQDEAFAVVGWKVVVIPPGTAQLREFTTQLRTVRTSVTGLLSNCWAT